MAKANARLPAASLDDLRQFIEAASTIAAPPGATHYLCGKGWQTAEEVEAIQSAMGEVCAALDRLEALTGADFASRVANAWVKSSKPARRGRPPGRSGGITPEDWLAAILPGQSAAALGRQQPAHSAEAKAKRIVRARAAIKQRGAVAVLIESIKDELARHDTTGLSDSDLDWAAKKLAAEALLSWHDWFAQLERETKNP